MKGIRKIFYIFRGQFLDSFSSGRVWLGYLVGIVLAAVSAYNYMGFANGRVYQITEPFLLGFTTSGNVTLYHIGFLIIIADAPFVNNRSTMVLYRTSRNQWFWGMSIYIIIHSILYYIVSFLTSCIFVIGRAYPENVWSRMMQQLIQAPSNLATGRWHLHPPGSALINVYQPYEALAHTMLLLILYSIIIAMLIFVFNTCFNKAAGSAIAGGIHIIGYILAFDNFGFAYGRFSLFFNGMFLFLIETDLSLFSSYTMMMLILCFLLFFGPGFMRSADFKYSIGEKND